MSIKLPIVAMVKQAFAQVISFKLGFGITVAYLLAVSAFVVAFVTVGLGLDLAALQEMANGNQPEIENVSADFFGSSFLIILLAMLFGYAWIFNMWIRFGAFGREGAFFPTTGESVQAALVTALKLFLIGVVLGLVVLTAFAILAMVGLVSLDPATAAEGQTLVSAITSNLIFLAVISGIYSLFSSNLTQTAIGSSKEEIGPPSVADFAIVLFLINAIFIIPLLVVQELLPVVVVLILQLLGSIWTTSAVPLAHGLRYDWRRQAFANAADGIMGASDDVPPKNQED